MASKTHEKSSARRARFGLTPTQQRSAIGNGSRLLANIDLRSAPARRFRDLQQAIIRDVSGNADVTEAMLQLIRSACGLVCLREALDARVLNGQEISTSDYCRISNSGLRRLPKDVTPSLEVYSQRLEMAAAK